MPQVPYDPVPQVQAEDHRIVRPEVPAIGAAFGENIAQGIQRAGQTGEQVGNELFSRAIALQQLNNETTARETSIKATQEMAIEQENFDSLEGKARHDALPQHLKALNDIRIKYRGTLNPRAAELFDAESANLQNRFTAAAAASAGNGLKTYADQTAQAQVELQKKSWVDGSDGEYEQKVTSTKKAIDDLAGIHNWSPAQHDLATLKATSELRGEQIMWQARRNPDQAYSTLEAAEKSGQLEQKEARIIRDYVDRQKEIIDSPNIADSVYDPQKPMKQAIDEAKAKADSMSHGNAALAQHAAQAVRSKYTFDAAVQRQQNAQDQNTILQGIGSNQFKNTQEAMANPDFRAAAERLALNDPKKVLNLEKMFEDHWKVENKRTNDGNFERLTGYTLRGAYDKFMDETANLPSIQLDDKQRTKIMAMRSQIMKDPNGDPRVTSAIKTLQVMRKQDLSALGILKTPGPDVQNPAWDAYVTALQGGIQAFEEQTGHQPSPQELNDKIAPQAIHAAGQRWGPFGVFQSGPETIPEAIKAAARQELQRNDPDLNPTDLEVMREVRRQQFKEFYQKSQPSAGSSTAAKSGKPVVSVSQ